MKWAIFAIGLAAVVPLAAWLRNNPRMVHKFWMVIGALPFIWGLFPKREIAFLGVPGWPGYSQGFDVSIIDLLLLAAVWSLPRSPNRIPFKFVFLIYIGAVMLSAMQAGNPTATFYYVWQLIRIFFAYMVIARACSDARITVALLKGLAIGVCFEAAVVGWQRFVVHYVQAHGTFLHQNLLGMAMHLVIFPFFALLLAGEKDWQPTAIPLLGILIDIFTTSRAAVGLAAAGFSFLFFLSMLKRWTPRKSKILAAGLVALIVLSPVVYRQFNYRFHSDASYEVLGGRHQLNKSAALMFADHPMGVGANNFVITSLTQGYAERANVSRENSHTFPHNLYWTTIAETGVVGFLALIAFLLRPILFALAWGWRHRSDRRADLLLGLATSLLIFYIHSFFEWNFFHDQIQYIIAIDLGLIGGLAAQLGYKPRPTQRGTPKR